MIAVFLPLILLAVLLVAASPSPLQEIRFHTGPLDFERIGKRDVTYFSEYFFNKGGQKKQRDFYNVAVTEPVTHVVFIAARGSGKTWAIRMAVMFELCFGRDIEIVILAPSMRQSKDNLFKEIAKCFRTVPGLMRMVKPDGIKESGYITMRNGNTLVTLTASPTSNIRGAHPSIIIIDETQHITEDMYNRDIRGMAGSVDDIDAATLYKAEAIEDYDERGAFIEEEGRITRIWETGTPIGEGHFNESVNDGIATVIEQPHWESVVISKSHIEEERRRLTKREFEAEYCCVFFVDDESAFERADLLRASVIDRDEPVFRSDQHRYVYTGGIDLGQKKDHSVMTILETDTRLHIRKMVAHLILPLDMQWRDQVLEMNKLVIEWNPHMIYVDSTGRTGSVYDRYIAPLDWNVIGFDFGDASKNELMRNMQLLFEDGEIEIYDDRSLFDELKRVVEKRQPGSKFPKYPKAKGYHDDQVMALGLAALSSSMYVDDERIDQDLVLRSLRESVASDYLNKKPDGEKPWWEKKRELSDKNKPFQSKRAGGQWSTGSKPWKDRRNAQRSPWRGR